VEVQEKKKENVGIILSGVNCGRVYAPWMCNDVDGKKVNGGNQQVL
jgi:hypothetical protein